MVCEESLLINTPVALTTSAEYALKASLPAISVLCPLFYLSLLSLLHMGRAFGPIPALHSKSRVQSLPSSPAPA